MAINDHNYIFRSAKPRLDLHKFLSDMHQSLYYFVIFLILSNCQPYKLEYTYEILEPDSLFIEYQCKGNYKSGFVMTRSDFTIADKIIKNAVTREHVEYSVYLSTSTINKFKRQYIPYINDKDEKMVFINCICRLLDYPVELDSGEYVFQRQELSKSIIWPDDGGDCYWRIWINLATKEFTLMVNGI